MDVELTTDNSLALVAVLNSGPRIPADLRETIFQPYVQADRPDGHRGGVGLGLAFCREVVSAHGGSVQATERDDRTCFVVRLPR